jgi:transcriptional regulator with XRE-family HTH domain
VNEKKELTTNETAEKLGVKPVTVRKWLTENRFPNARREDTPRGVVWYIPESDLSGFQKPLRGRPKENKV